jgi:hypothetical protein
MPEGHDGRSADDDFVDAPWAANVEYSCFK